MSACDGSCKDWDVDKTTLRELSDMIHEAVQMGAPMDAEVNVPRMRRGWFSIRWAPSGPTRPGGVEICREMPCQSSDVPSCHD